MIDLRPTSSHADDDNSSADDKDQFAKTSVLKRKPIDRLARAVHLMKDAEMAVDDDDEDDHTRTRAKARELDRFLTKTYDFTIVVSLITGIGMIAYVVYMSTAMVAHALTVEQTFLIWSMVIHFLILALMCIMRGQRPVDIGCMFIFYICGAFILGFLFCTHLKIVTSLIKHEPHPTGSM